MFLHVQCLIVSSTNLLDATPELATAFNQYCNTMMEDGRVVHLQEVANKLRIALGDEARFLIKVIPNLSNLLEPYVEHDRQGEDEDEDDVYAQKRIQYLLCRFVEVISSFSGAPIILFMDVVQWVRKLLLPLLDFVPFYVAILPLIS